MAFSRDIAIIRIVSRVLTRKVFGVGRRYLFIFTLNSGAQSIFNILSSAVKANANVMGNIFKH